MYIIISLVLILISLFLINFSRLEKFRNENKRTFDFSMSLISTFIGLFIALSVNTILGNINQKKNLVKLLSATNLAIENNEMRTRGMYINNAQTGVNLSELVKNIPVELPKLYPMLESNSLVNDYFSSNGFRAYILCLDNMETFVANVNSPTTTDAKKLQVLNDYLKYLDMAKKVNQLEMDRLSGNISQSSEDKSLQQVVNQIVSN